MYKKFLISTENRNLKYSYIYQNKKLLKNIFLRLQYKKKKKRKEKKTLTSIYLRGGFIFP